jgi:hypothetical protein
MTERPAWKSVLREPNAAGWLTLMILVLAIGCGTLYFGAHEPNAGMGEHAALAQQGK